MPNNQRGEKRRDRLTTSHEKAETAYVGEYNIWQYSENGTVSGISGKVDLNYWYGEFPMSQTNHTHSYSSIITCEATCTTLGIRTYTCTVCGEQYSEEIPALGHSYGEWVITRQPTCTVPGVETRTCTRCDDVQSRALPANGHSFQNGICTVCGESDGSVVKGDINGDGAITSADAVLLARYLIDLIPFTEDQKYAADFNMDGYVSSADAVLLTKVLID